MSPFSSDPAADPLARRLAGLAMRARAALWWERVWPPLAALLSLAALFVAVAWFGYFLEAPRWAKLAAATAFAASGLGVVVHALATTRRPGRADALARLDRDSGLAHRPATTLGDALADTQADPVTRALWEAHRARQRAGVAGLRLRAPSPRLVERDRYALRAAALLLMVAAGFVAGDQKETRLLAAFDWRSPEAIAAASRVDAYVDPPGYTGRPPIILPTRPGDAQAGVFADATRAVEAPTGSRVVIRGSAGDVVVSQEGGLAAPPIDPAETAQARAARLAEQARRGETVLILSGDARLTIKAGRRDSFVFDLKAIPDAPPTVALLAPPKADQKTLALRYRAEDDYGLESLEARFSRPIVGGRPSTGRSLYDPPKAPLASPAGGAGEAETTIELSEHPWAGARVTMTLAARDGAGQEGLSAPVETTLPARVFTQPMARALVEQRRDLALSPDSGRGRVLEALSALRLAPDLFGVSAGVYLGLSTAQTRLRHARDDDQLRDVADFLWEMALRIEDGDLSQAQRELKQAQQALREAMERGATPEELKKLMEDLRAAMDKFLREFAEKNPPRQGELETGRDQEMSRLDLDKMLRRMEEMARRGDMAEAQRMLDQLERMMDNLRRADRDSAREQARREMNRQMGEMDRLLREQQRLRDDTYRKDQQERRQRQGRRSPQGEDPQGDEQAQGDPQEQDDPQSSDEQLAQRQRQLRDKLDELQERMKRQGLDKEESFDEAEQAMREAERELGQGEEGQSGGEQDQQGMQGQKGRRGQNGQGQSQGKGQAQGPGDRRRAVDAQGRAVEALRKGMQGLQNQMGQGEPGEGEPQVGENGGQGDPRGDDRGQGGRALGPLDPLDRPRREQQGRSSSDRGLDDRARAAERARRVQEELRRRLGEPDRPREELDYYERLLRR